MIIKSLSRKSNGSQLVQYVLRYALNPEKTEQFLKSRAGIDRTKLTVRHNIRARSLKGIIREFEKNESYRLVKRKDSVKLFHTVLSLSSKDRELVDEKILHDLGKQFVTLRGLDCLFCGAVHFDKNHGHLHIIHSGTKLNGRSARISKQQFHSLKLNLERYQQEKYPFLVHSIVDHSKKRQRTKAEIVKAVQANRQTKKEALLASLDRLYEKATSKEQFLSQLKQEGYQVYERGGRAQGVMVENVKFRFSRLGFDEERWQSLDQSNGLLLEMQELRKGTERQAYRESLQMDVPETPRIPASPPVLRMEDELSELRRQRNSRDRGVSRDDDFERSRGEPPTLFDHINE